MLFDFPSRAKDESLIINYFINAPLDVDWSELNDILQNVYENWIIDEKIKLLSLLLGAAIAIGNEFLISVLKNVVNEWRDGIQDEINDIDDIDERDKLIDLFETLDTISI